MAAGEFPEQVPATESAPSARPLLMALIAICSILVFTYALRLDERDRMEAAIAAQEAANVDAAARGAQLREDLALVAGPGFLDEMVRNYLLLGKEGETRLVAINAPQLAAAVRAGIDAAAPSALPIWRQWIDVLAPGLLN